MKQTRNRYQKGSLKTFKRPSGYEVWTFRWNETSADGKRRPRKLTVGSVEDFPTERSARLALEALDLNINHDESPFIRAPRTVKELIRHYEMTELAADSDTVSYSTRSVYKLNLRNWIEPRYGKFGVGELENLPGVHVEQWLKTLPLSPASKSKIRNILSALCSHALRWGWMKVHPIKGKVRQSAKAVHAQVPLEFEELYALFCELELIYRAMILLAFAAGLRRGEVFALQWMDIDFQKKTVSVCKSVWHQNLGPTKTKESEQVLPLDDDMIDVIFEWRSQTMYANDADWVFASAKMKGCQPLWPEGVLHNHLQPAAKRAGITTRVTWHTFRHTFATLLLANEEDVKTAQSLLRHANPQLTLGIYAHSIDRIKRNAQTKIIDAVLPKQLSSASGA